MKGVLFAPTSPPAGDMASWIMQIHGSLLKKDWQIVWSILKCLVGVQSMVQSQNRVI